MHWDRIVINVKDCKGWEIESQLFKGKKKTEPIHNLHAMNEIVIEWGPNSFLTNLDLFIDGNFLTTI